MAEPDAKVRYERRSESLEFDRVAFFSDAVFAIAMTLLVVGIGIPHVRDAKLGDALGKKSDEIFSFFLSFVVIGYYWLAHHRFFAQLRALDPFFMLLNLFYLAAIAFTPFPTALIGSYSENPEAVVIYAATLATASLLESLLLVRAHVAGLMRRALRTDVFRFGLLASLAPVVVFLVSIPIAYADTSLALLSWLLLFPAEMALNRFFRPADADDFFKGRAE